MSVQITQTSQDQNTRRGSALLIVIGTLALIAVFAAIYITIGQGDRRAAATVRSRNDAQNLQNTYAEYIAGVIASDRVDVFTQHQDDGALVFLNREITDAPFTDWTVRSESNNLYERFNASGRHTQAGLAADLDFRVPYDSWLASTRPTYLGDPLARPFSSGFAAPEKKEFLDNRDWLQITNMAPDGRFVNLYNLRPQAFAGGRGGFNAEPGVGVTAFPSGDRIRRMSEGLSLLTLLNPGDPDSPIRAQTDGFWLPGSNVPQGTLDPNIPAHWTMYQRYMFFPMDQPFLMYDQNGALADWSSPDYPPYQYADADGDGMADARWFELTSAQTPWTSPTPRDDIKRLYDSREFRVFAAARVIDLSSLVNVNTATDGIVAPASDDPLGITPADIDLRRLLTMQDAAKMYTQGNTLLPLSFSDLHRPTIYRGTGNDGNNQHLFERSEADYSTYEQFIDGSAVPPRLNPDSNAILIGRYAYDALRIGIDREYGLTGQYFGRDYFNNGPPAEWIAEELVQYARDPFFTDYGSTNPPTMISAKIRKDQYREVGRQNPASPSVRGEENSFGAGLYGMDDLAELLTFHGINDPATTSRLESVVGGRLMDSGRSENRLSPLLSNRPLEVDRRRHGSIRTSNNLNRPRVVNGMIAEESMALFALSPRKLMTPMSGSVGFRPSTVINLNASIPQELTIKEAQSSIGAAANDALAMFGIYSKALAAELQSSVSGAVDDLWALDLSIRRTDPIVAPYATLFYGHRGPEFAYRVAAHAAVNMKDMHDNDDEPTVATVLINDVSGSMRSRFDILQDAADDDTIDITTNQDSWFYPGLVGTVPLRFDVPEAYVHSGFDGAAETLHRRAFNVYGIEPMPVITEVSSMYVYADAPLSAGGDTDWTEITGGGIVPLDTRDLTIQGGNDPANPDFLLELFAVQLTNPFDEPINLGGLGGNQPLKRKGNVLPGGMGGVNTNNFQFLYYIEYNGRFFKLGEYQEDNPPLTAGGVDYSSEGGPPPGVPIDPVAHAEFIYRDVTLGPGETRVFYAIAQNRFDGGFGADGLDAKWEAILSNPDIGFAGGIPDLDSKPWTGPAQNWVEHQLRVAGSGPGRNAAHIYPFNPTTGELEPMSGSIELHDPAAAVPAIPGVGPSRVRDARQVRLWRKHLVEYEEFDEQTIPTSPTVTRRNLIENDILVDRFLLSDTLQNELRTSTDTIGDTVSLPEDVSGIPGVNRNDNTGLTIVRWKTERRRDSLGEDPNRVAWVQPWMIHSRRTPANTRVVHRDTLVVPSLDLPDVNTFFTSTGIISRTSTVVTEKSDLEAQSSLKKLFLMANQSSNRPKVLQTLGMKPDEKSRVGTGNFPDAGNNSAAKFDVEYLLANNASQNMYPGSGDGPKPEIFNKRTWSVERVADLLLTAGIGITYAPDPTRVADQSVIDAEWITFPEAMAIALGYETPVATDNASADSIWYDAVLPSGPTGQPEYVLDDLHLSIDNYVAYLDQDINQQYTPGLDVRRGTGVPVALGVIDSVRGNGWLTQMGDSALTPTEQSALALTRPTFGKININTAPVEVLRLLPGLSPSLEQYRDPASPALPVDEWWANRGLYSGTNLPDLTTPIETPDIAAGMVAYRDRLRANPRPDSRPTSWATQALDYASEDFFGAMVGFNGRNMIDEATAGPGTWDRAGLAGIDGLRGTPGFGSLGEVLAITLDTDPANTDVAPLLPEARHLTGGYYGIDGQRLGTADIDTDADGSPDDYVSLDLQVYGTKTNPREGQVIDDYAERLAVANGILNTISVRSDYFAVWFVVQGFRESDVANLGEFDPLVPSFKKRYLMVVDRSNVIKEGQEPKILLLKEVPL